VATADRSPIVGRYPTFIAAASAGEGRDAVLARTIIGLGAAVGLPTVAEGIEVAAQVELVRDLGCRYGQGYFLARPADAAHIATLLGTAAAAAPRPVRPRRGPAAVIDGQWALA
jgi:predicted signal transduction protein with EAL and GGDEF domain